MRWMFILAVVGLALIAHGCKESRLNSLAADAPTAISLAELEANGYGDNAHVVVSDFMFLDWDYVYGERKGKWTEAWVPAVPLGGAYHTKLLSMYDEDGDWPEDVEWPDPERIGTVVKQPGARSELDVVTTGRQETIQGIVINEIAKIGSEERGLLSSSYPGIDFTQCLVLEVGRLPQGGMIVFLSLIGGLVCLGGAGYMAWSAYQSRPEAQRKRREDLRARRRS